MAIPFRLRLRLTNISFVVLFLVAAGLLMWLSRTYHHQFDWTRNNRNTLSPASVTLLKKLEQPVKITAFASDQPEMRKGIAGFIERYQRYKPNLVLEFVDPDKEPGRVREAGVQFDGELLIEYGGNKETMQQLKEETLTNILARLARTGERWVVFLTGHGERSPDRQANFDLSTWAAQMKKRGLKTRTLALGETPQIPQNTSALVIAGARAKLLPGEVKQIEAYINRGGNLLWLADPGPQYGLEPLAESLGIEFQPGVIVDPNSQILTNNPTFIVVARYGPHPVVQDLGRFTVFPDAVGLKTTPPGKEAGAWQSTVLLDTNPTAWAETGGITKDTKFDKGQDVRGPLTLGVTLMRERDKRQQRIAVIGDGDFLSNSFIGIEGNLDLGMNLVNWTSSDDEQINVPTRTASDVALNLTPTVHLGIVVVFLLVLPLSLIGSGLWIWWRRRRR